MKTIKIFLASSEELTDDRNAFGNLVRRLDKAYEKRGIRIELFEWEDYDAAYNDRRKQDEYNDQVRASDMFLALFHRVAGRFTIEEFNVATEEFRKKASPKVYTYCRDLQPGEIESPELIEFKQHLFKEMGHYWSRYGNRDTMQLHFVMQLMLVETENHNALKVENGSILFDDMHVASMDNLPFASENVGYRKMKTELEKLPIEIEKTRKRVENYPDDDGFREDLQLLLNRYNALKEDFQIHQQALFDTAKRVTKMQLGQISGELSRAINEFEAGRVEAANAILDGIEQEAERHVEQLDRDRALVEQDCALVHQDIEALLLKTNTLMADISIPIEERVQQVLIRFHKADEWAQKSSLAFEKYTSLLFDYGEFLRTHALFDEALKIRLRECQLYEVHYGTKHYYTAATYLNLGQIYVKLDDFKSALEYYKKALDICEKQLGWNHIGTASTYSDIGNAYNYVGNFNKALDFHQKALSIRKKMLGEDNIETARSYVNIGGTYYNIGNYNLALESYQLSLKIKKKVLDPDNISIAISYSSIGQVYDVLGNYNFALDCHLKALDILEKQLGRNHPDTARSYSLIGTTYNHIGKNALALEYYH